MARTLDAAPPVRRLRLYEQIAGRIVDFILDGDLKPGSALPPEGEIARSLGVSRPAVREAMVALETAGLVLARSGGGVFVLRQPRRGQVLPWARRGDPGPGPLEQLRARRLIEPELAAEAARVALEAEIAALDDLARAVTAAAAAGLPFAEEAVEFHVMLARAAAIPTLADCLAGLLDSPTAGDIEVDGQASAKLNDTARTALRRRTIGFVYQFHQLLPEFSALENIVLPQMIAGVSRRAAAVRARELLTIVGLKDRLNHRPGKLSGGEQQRVAIVRAIANQPKLLLADEPTGNLDPTTAEGVFAELMRLVRTTGLAALIATHNLELARRMDRVVTLRDGALVPA